MASLLGEKLFRCADKAGSALLLDLVLRDQARFLWLDDLLPGPGTSLRRPVDGQYNSRVAGGIMQPGRTSWAPQWAWTF